MLSYNLILQPSPFLDFWFWYWQSEEEMYPWLLQVASKASNQSIFHWLYIDLIKIEMNKNGTIFCEIIFYKFESLILVYYSVMQLIIDYAC